MYIGGLVAAGMAERQAYLVDDLVGQSLKERKTTNAQRCLPPPSAGLTFDACCGPGAQLAF